MKAAGIITEYNPFHNGHKYHIEETRRITGADYVVAVMSGDFCQRGIPAVADKYLRAQMALENGADLVLELPVRFASASAEFFADGAVSILEGIGLIDCLCFGSECSDTSLLSEIAELLLNEPPLYRDSLREHLRNGLSFPAARAQALLSLPVFSGRQEEISGIFSSPNSILGIEYLKSLKRRKSKIIPYSLTRLGAGYHDLSPDHAFSSASGIRALLERETTENDLSVLFSREDCALPVPASVAALLKDSLHHSFPVFENDFSGLLHYRLLLESRNGFSSYLDSSDALSSRIIKNLPYFESFTSFAAALKSKEITHTRINRLLLHILLDLKKDGTGRYTGSGSPGYARILGLRKDAAPLLGELKKRSALTLLSKPSDADQKLSALSLELMNETVLASHIYQSAAAAKFHTAFRSEYTRQFLKL